MTTYDSALIFGQTDWGQVFSALPPGGHAIGVASPKEYPLLAADAEDAGFEVRDSLHIAAGSGPNGQEPAHWVGALLRKPVEGTVAANVLSHGVGGLNIDACRVRGAKGNGVWGTSNENCHDSHTFNGSPDGKLFRSERHFAGRWPSNTVLIHNSDCLMSVSDEGNPEWACSEICPSKNLNQQSGESKSTGGRIGKKATSDIAIVPAGQYAKGDPGFGDTGGASRYFQNISWVSNDKGLLPREIWTYLEAMITPPSGKTLRRL